MVNSTFKIQTSRFKNFKKGFSLVELLVVIAVLAVLSIVAYLGIQRSQMSTMNEKVTQDLLAIRDALESYKQDNGHYPMFEDLTLGEDKNVLCFSEEMAYMHTCDKASFLQTQVDNKLLTKRYLQEVPTDPRTGSRYSYGVTADGQAFQVAGILQEGEDDSWKARVVGNLGEGAAFPGLIRAFDAPNFVTDEGKFLPYSPNPLQITARLNGVKGTVMVNDEVGLEGQVLQVGDKVKTAPESTVQLFLSDGSITYLDENAELQLLPNSEVLENSKDDIITKIRLKLFQGSTWNKVVHLADKSEFNIETTTAIAGVRGTEFGIDADENELIMFSGVVASELKTPEQEAQSNGEGQFLNFDVDSAFAQNQEAEGDGSNFVRYNIPAQGQALGAGVTLNDNEKNQLLNKYYQDVVSLSAADRPYIVKAEAHANGKYTLHVAFNGLTDNANVEVSGFEIFTESQMADIRLLKEGVESPLPPIEQVELKDLYQFDLSYTKDSPLYLADENRMESIVLRAYLDTKNGRVYSGLSWPAIGLEPEPNEEYAYSFDNAETYPEWADSPEMKVPVEIVDIGDGEFALNEGEVEFKSNVACDWSVGGGNNPSGVFTTGQNVNVAVYNPLNPDLSPQEKAENVGLRFEGTDAEKVNIKCTDPDDNTNVDTALVNINYAPKTISEAYQYAYKSNVGVYWQDAYNACDASEEGGHKDWTLPSKLTYQKLDINAEKTNLCQWNGEKCEEVGWENAKAFALLEEDNTNLLSMKEQNFAKIKAVDEDAKLFTSFRCIRMP